MAAPIVVSHGGFAVAPWKRTSQGCSRGFFVVFHGGFAVAPLKERTGALEVMVPAGFPRRIRRGPIEGFQHLAHERCHIARFPRRIRRGPIEGRESGEVAGSRCVFSTADSPWPH